MLIRIDCFVFSDDVVHTLENKKDDKDQETIQSSTSPDPGYYKNTINITNKSQEASLFPAGSHKALAAVHSLLSLPLFVGCFCLSLVSL